MLSFRAIDAFYITPDTNTNKNRRTDRISCYMYEYKKTLRNLTNKCYAIKSNI